MAQQSKQAEEDEDVDEDVLTRARAVVDTYRVVVAPCKDGGFIGYTLELPGVVSFATDRHKCIDAVIADQTAAIVVAMRHDIEVPGAPERREILLNLRVSKAEKARLQHAAKQAKHDSLSDYIRSAVLAASNARLPRRAPQRSRSAR